MTFFKEQNKKTFKKGIDKPQGLWYNKSVNKG